jgi:hypothetical protein
LKESEKLYDFIKELDEEKFRNILYNYFVNFEELVYLTHGSLEYGADLILYQPGRKDILDRVVVFLFQIKKGDINNTIWRSSLHSQLYELYDREIKFPPYDSEHIPRRIILITSGEIKDNAVTDIRRMNIKHHIPIEYFDGPRIVEFLINRGYNLDQAKQDYERAPH